MIKDNASEIVGPYCGDNECNGKETCSSCEKDCNSCRGSGGIISTFDSSEIKKAQICEVCLQDLRQHIKKRQNIDYTLEELKILTTKINAKVQAGFTLEQTRILIENFEDECDAYMPMLGGLIPGRYKSIAIPTITVASIIFIALVLYLVYVRVRFVKKKRKKK